MINPTGILIELPVVADSSANRHSSTMVPMDEIDSKLIALLRDDARLSVATLAKKLGVARGTVQNRIAKLEADGTIVGTRCDCARKPKSGDLEHS